MQQGRRRGIRVSMEHSSGNLVSKYPSTTVVHRKCYQQPECLPYSKYDANGRHLPSCYAIDIECHLAGWLAGWLACCFARSLAAWMVLVMAGLPFSPLPLSPLASRTIDLGALARSVGGMSRSGSGLLVGCPFFAACIVLLWKDSAAISLRLSSLF